MLADACAEYAAAEAVVISTAQSGSATLAQLRDAYGEMKTRIADLSARVRSIQMQLRPQSGDCTCDFT